MPHAPATRLDLIGKTPPIRLKLPDHATGATLWRKCEAGIFAAPPRPLPQGTDHDP